MRRYHHHNHHRPIPIKSTTITTRILATFFTAFVSSRQISSSSSHQRVVVAEAFTTTTTATTTTTKKTQRDFCRNDSQFLFDLLNPRRRPLQRDWNGSYRSSNFRNSCTRRSMMTTTSSGTTSSSSKDKQKQQQQRQDMMDIMQNALYRIRAVNYMPLEIRRSLLDFCIDNVCLGKVRPAVAEMLAQKDSTVFQLIRRRQDSDENDNSHDYYLTLAPTVGTTCDERSAAINSVMVQLRDQGLVKGWRDEMYPVAATFYNDDSPPVFVMERSAVHYLGVLEYGIHINGIVNVDDVASNGIVNVDDVASNDNSKDKNDHGSPGTIVSSPHQEQKMWIARRSATKSKYPNMLDHIVAGGQPAGISLLDNCIKECAEEAGIPEHVTRAGLRPAGAISYETYNGSKSDTVTRAVLFCYDLHLPRDFVPRVVDGEVQEFMTWSVPQLLASLAPDFNDPIKPNCYPVMIDWLIRQGHLSPDVPGYLDVLKELRSGDCQ